MQPRNIQQLLCLLLVGQAAAVTLRNIKPNHDVAFAATGVNSDAVWQISEFSGTQAKPRSWFVKKCIPIYEPEGRGGDWANAEMGVNRALKHWCKSRHADAKIEECLELKPQLKKIHEDFNKCPCPEGRDEPSDECIKCKENIHGATKGWCKDAYDWICDDLNICGGVNPGIEVPYANISIKFNEDNKSFVRADPEGNRSVRGQEEDFTVPWMLESSFEVVAPRFIPSDMDEGMGLYSFKSQLTGLYVTVDGDNLVLQEAGGADADQTFWIDEVPAKSRDGRTCSAEAADGAHNECVFWGGMRFRPVVDDNRIWSLGEDGKSLTLRRLRELDNGRFDLELQRRGTWHFIEPLSKNAHPVATYGFDKSLGDETSPGMFGEEHGKKIRYDTDDGVEGASLDVFGKGVVSFPGFKKFQWGDNRRHDMTVTFWFKRTGSFDQTAGLVSAGNAFNVQMTGNDNGQSVTAEVNGVKMNGAKASRHEWHFAVLRVRSPNVAFFIDGERVAGGKFDGEKIPKNDCPLLVAGVGCEASEASGQEFEGKIDSLHVWYRSLPEGEIDALLEEGRTSLREAADKRAADLLAEWGPKGCFALASLANKDKHMGRTPTSDKKEIANKPHLKEAPKDDEPPEPLENQFPFFLQEDPPEPAIDADAKPAGKPLSEMDGPKPIVGYLDNVDMFEDPLNTLYVKVVKPLDGKAGKISLEACLYPNYFVVEKDNENVELQKLQREAEGDGKESNENDKDFLKSASLGALVDAFAPNSLVLRSPYSNTSVMVADGDSVIFKEVEANRDFEDSSSWVETFTPLSMMECPPSSFKMEIYDKGLPEMGKAVEPFKLGCRMIVDVDAGDLEDMGLTGAWSAVIKGNMDVEKNGYYRLSAAKTSSVRVKLDSNVNINVNAEGVTEREEVFGPIKMLEKGIHRVEEETTGSGKEQGFSVGWERVCPEKTITSDGAKIEFPITNTGTGEVKLACPDSHNGDVRMQCDAGATSFKNMDGKCEEKKCPETVYASGSVEVTFKEAKQATGDVYVDCPKSHNGRVKRTCAPNEEVWSAFGGECVEKTCDNEEYMSGGANVKFVEVPQGTGEVTVTCPPTHHGEITRTCKENEEEWSGSSGKCEEKSCPDIEVESGGARVMFGSRLQGFGDLIVKCPPTHHGEIKLTCMPEVDVWSPLEGECVEKECKSEEIESGGAKVEFPTVVQGFGKVTVVCPPNFHGELTRECFGKSDQWGQLTGKCSPTTPHFLIRNGNTCSSEHKDMGEFDTSGECAVAVKDAGHDFFIYSNFKKLCRAETTISVRCPEGWKNGPSFDFYSLAPGGWSAEDDVKCGKGKGEEIGDAADCRASCLDDKDCSCVVYFRPKECKENDKSCKGRTCQKLAQCNPQDRQECPEYQQGYVTYEKTRCPRQEWSSGTAKLSHKSVFSGHGEVTLPCPAATHTGELTVTCAANAAMWSQPKGQCIEKFCPAKIFQIKGASVYFPMAKLSQGKVTAKCPATHTGQAHATCMDGDGAPTEEHCFKQEDYNLGDIGDSFSDVPSPGHCQKKCQANAACRIFVYDPVDKMCWLKCAAGKDCKASANGATEGPLKTDRYISGTNSPPPEHCRKACFKKADYNLGDIGESFENVAKASDCQAKCKDEAECRIFVYDPVDKMCWLKCAAGEDCKGSANGATEGPMPTDRYISGTNKKEPAGCEKVSFLSMGHVAVKKPEDEVTGPEEVYYREEDGNCEMKKCPEIKINAGPGITLKFKEEVQGSGTQKVQCPDTHTGSMSATCAPNAEAWANMRGACVMKTCAATKVDGVSFPQVVQGHGKVTGQCPSGFTGSISMICEPNAQAYKGKEGKCHRICPKFQGTGVANWWGSFDRAGWSMAGGPMTGFYRTGDNWLWNIEEAGYNNYVNNYNGQTCTSANWWGSFDRQGWSNCPNGYFIHGLYRTGNIGHWRNNQLYHIEMAHCCKPRETSGYGRCMNANWWSSFDQKGWSSCPAGYAMTGMYRNGCNQIYCLEEVRCCELPSTCS